MCYGIFGNSGPSPADDSGMGDAVYGRGNSGNSMEGQVLGLLLMQRGALKGVLQGGAVCGCVEGYCRKGFCYLP